jgi:Icc-related predicted phosphoesterase
MRAVTIVLLSDTHELHRDVEVPPGDLLIHAGDITFFSKRPSVLADFNMWLGQLPHRHKVVIPGNHDSLLSKDIYRSQITNAHLLIDSGVEIEGLRIWGSPVTPYGNVAFGIAGSAERAEHWSSIPEDLDILVTHGPPHRVLDCAPGEIHHGGDPELRLAVIRKRPRLHVFGHVHSAYGMRHTERTLFVNAALAGELGDLDKMPIVLRMSER